MARCPSMKLPAAAAAVLLLAACAERKPIILGFMGEISGSNADIGEGGRNGVLLAVERVNAGGGIRGRRVELVVRDDLSNAEGARRALDGLTSRGAEVVIGPFNTAMAEAVLPEAEKTGVLLVSPTVSAEKFVGKDDGFVKLNSSTRDNGALYAEFLAARRGAPAAALAYDLRNRGFSESWTNEFVSSYARLGGRVAGAVQVDASKESGYGDAVRGLLALKPACMVFVANAVDSARLAQLVRKTDRNVLLVAAEWASTDQLIELGGAGVEGLLTMQTFDAWYEGDAWKAFRKEFIERFRGPPGFSAVAAYDAATVVFSALSARKSGQTIKAALLDGGPYAGLQQEIRFDRFGDTKRRMTFVEVVGGAYAKAK